MNANAARPAAVSHVRQVTSWLTAVLLLGMALLAGCGAGNPHPGGSFERAQFFMEKEKNLEAVAAFEAFVRNNPTDSLAAEAQYLKSMLYLDMEEYPLAAVEFQILRKDFPTSDRIEDSFFQEGVAYFRQVGHVQRDMTGAHEARLHFLKFSQEFPSSPYMDQVRDYMQQISDLMVAKRLKQAHVFWQLKRYAAVDMTLTTALEDEGGSTLLDEVLWQLGRVAEKLDDPDKAARMYERLITGYPESRFYKRAQAALRALDEDEAMEEDEES